MGLVCTYWLCIYVCAWCMYVQMHKKIESYKGRWSGGGLVEVVEKLWVEITVRLETES